MGQNLASVHLDATQWAAVDDAIGVLEQALASALVVLGPEGRRRAVKMGDASEAFCRLAYTVMRENAALIPRAVDLDEMARDLASHAAFADRRVRIDRLVEKIYDTDIALGSDAMAAALKGYALLKLNGQTEGLDSLRRDLGKRFERGAKRRAEVVGEAA